MQNSEWQLFVIRTQILMRMQQLDLSARLRTRISAIIAQVSDIARLTDFAKRLESKGRELPQR